MLAVTRNGHRASEAELTTAFTRLAARTDETTAIELGRTVLAAAPHAEGVRLWVAGRLEARGDDTALREVLAQPAANSAPVLLMLAADLHQRGGDLASATRCYEWVVSQDMAHAVARERLRSIAATREAGPSHGATLAGGAAIAGRYQLQRELGRGGAGVVFEACDTRIGRNVALKVYHARGHAQTARLLNEARVPARFEYPGIVRVLDLDPALVALAMELLPGGSLKAEIAAGGIGSARIAHVVASCADALAVVHHAGIVHRDLKPSNVLLRAGGQAVLTDFGMACRRGEQPTAPAEGTLAYMAPEQRRGELAEPSMDVYALGVMLRELLAATAAGPTSVATPAQDALLGGTLAELADDCLVAHPDARPSAAMVASRARQRP